MLHQLDLDHVKILAKVRTRPGRRMRLLASVWHHIHLQNWATEEQAVVKACTLAPRQPST
jgi:hypothetical protein